MSIRIPVPLLEKLIRSVEEEKFSSISMAFRSYAELGIHVESFRTSIKDPEFLKSIDELKQGNKIFEWVETLTDQQTDAMVHALKMEQEKRGSNGNLR